MSLLMQCFCQLVEFLAIVINFKSFAIYIKIDINSDRHSHKQVCGCESNICEGHVRTASFSWDHITRCLLSHNKKKRISDWSHYYVGQLSVCAAGASHIQTFLAPTGTISTLY